MPTAAQKLEIVKCGRDPLYFMKTYVRVKTPVGGNVPFKTWPFQDACVDDFTKHRLNIVLKSRQLGLSTLAAAYALWMAIFQKDRSILVIATKLPTAINFIKKVKFALQNLPPWLLMPTLVGESKSQLTFSNGSEITATPTSEDAGRSEALSLLIIDEAAWIRNFEDIWTGLYPTISCLVGDTKVLLDDGFHDISDVCSGHSVGDYFTLDRPIWGKDGFERTSHGYVSPFSKTLKLTTRSGRIIEATRAHPLWSASHGGIRMRSTDKLCVGDALRIEHSMGVFSRHDVVDVQFARQLGIFIAEGWIPRMKKDDDAPRYSIMISNSAPEIRDELLQDGFRPLPDSIKLMKCSRTAVLAYQRYGVDPRWKCDTKRVPSAIWRSSKAVQASFLSGYFDGDGCGTAGVSAVTTSEGLAQDVQLLMMNMGIITHVRKKIADRRECGVRRMPTGHVLQNVRDSWTIHVPRSQLKKFEDDIGFKVHEKQRKLRVEIDSKFGNADSIEDRRLAETPKVMAENVKQLVARVLKALKLNVNQLRYTHKLRCGKTPTQKWLRTFLNVVEANDNQKSVATDDIELLRELVPRKNASWYWDPIVSIEENAAVTYDFTVPSSHTFIQNLILGSNTGGRAIVLSTPNGVGGQYYKLWVDAEAKLNDFNPIKLLWSVRPDHDQAWFEKETRGMGRRKVAQEYLCDFLTSGETFLQPDELDWLRQLIREPIDRQGFDRGVWVWVPPRTSRKYVISGDVARGSSNEKGDYSGFHIIDALDCEVVAEYLGRIPPDRLADLLNEFGLKYNSALIAPENNTFGHATCTRLRDHHKYPRLFYQEAQGDAYNYRPYSDAEIPGFSTQGGTRPQILTKLEEMIRNKALKIHSKRFCDQMQAFVWAGAKAQAAKDSHDDLVMSLAIGAWVVDQLFGYGISKTLTGQALLAAVSVVRRDVTMMSSTQVTPLINPRITTSLQHSVYHDVHYTPKKGALNDYSWLAG